MKTQLQQRVTELETEINSALADSCDYTLSRVKDTGIVGRHESHSCIIYGSPKRPANKAVDFANSYKERVSRDYQIDYTGDSFHERSPDEAFHDFKKHEALSLINLSNEFKNIIAKERDLGDFHFSELTFDRLLELRNYVMRQMRGLGVKTPDDWLMEIELPKKTWAKIIYDRGVKTWTNRLNNIQCSTVEFPTRVYFNKGRPVGVYPKGVTDEEGNFFLDENCDYAKDFITIEGKRHYIFNLSFFIHPLSFQRAALNTGDREAKYFQFELLSEHQVENNECGDKHALFARAEFRVIPKYPELSFYVSHK